MTGVSAEKLSWRKQCVKRVEKAFSVRGVANMVVTYRIATALWAIGDPIELKMPGSKQLQRCSREDFHAIFKEVLPSWMDGAEETIDSMIEYALYEQYICIPEQNPEHPKQEMLAVRAPGITRARKSAGV